MLPFITAPLYFRVTNFSPNQKNYMRCSVIIKPFYFQSLSQSYYLTNWSTPEASLVWAVRWCEQLKVINVKQTFLWQQWGWVQKLRQPDSREGKDPCAHRGGNGSWANGNCDHVTLTCSDVWGLEQRSSSSRLRLNNWWEYLWISHLIIHFCGIHHPANSVSCISYMTRNNLTSKYSPFNNFAWCKH